jgi:hypothetical protein
MNIIRKGKIPFSVNVFGFVSEVKEEEVAKDDERFILKRMKMMKA